MYRIFIALMTLILSGSVATAKSKDIIIKIVETSDVHGSFFPYDFITRKPKAGTMARVSTFVNQLRRNHGTQNVYLLDNGDILQGQPISYYYNYLQPQKENIAASAVNYLKYDVSGVGNHDIETGHAVYDKWIKELQCPVVAANIIDTEKNSPYILPYYTIRKENGVKVAVIGMLTPAIPNWLEEELWKGLRFDEMINTAKKAVAEVKAKEQPDVIVGLFHSGWDGGITTPTYMEDASKRVAEEVLGFDVVFFGHDHKPRNISVTNIDGKEVLCLDPANNAQYAAVATLTLRPLKKRAAKNGKRYEIIIKEGTLEDMTPYEMDEKYMAHFENHINEVKNWANRKIGSFKNTISTKDCFFGSSAFNDLILNLELQITHADIAFNAPLGFNSSIKAGAITVADMFNLYKYENQLYVMKLTGKEIKDYLEMSYNLWVNTMQSADDHLLLLQEDTRDDSQRMGFKNFSFNFDSAAGIDYEVDVTKPYGEKVRILRMSNGEPFDETKWYAVAVNSYRGNGGGELLTKGAGIPQDELKGRITWRSEKDQRFYLMEEIEKAGELNPQPNNNWKFVPTEWTEKAAKRDRKILFGEETPNNIIIR